LVFLITILSYFFQHRSAKQRYIMWMMESASYPFGFKRWPLWLDLSWCALYSHHYCL